MLAPKRELLDFLQPQRVAEVVADSRPDFVINCAAYTQVDRAESEPDSVFVINSDAAGSLAAALTARGANVKSMTGRARAVKEKDEIRRTKVTEIAISIDVEIDDKDLPVFEKCKKIMQRGCLITYSLEDAIEIEYEINRF